MLIIIIVFNKKKFSDPIIQIIRILNIIFYLSFNVVGHWVTQDIELRTLAWHLTFHFIFSITQ